MVTQIKFIKKILFCTITILLLALSIEGISRLGLLIFTKEPVVPRSIGRYDELLGWAMEPSTRATSSRTGYEIEYKINSKGLRDDETSYERSEGIYRIVLLGDSRTFGFGVPIDKHFSVLLEGYFRDVEVINMGVSGFGVDQNLLYLQYEGVRYKPDLILTYIAHYGDHRHMHTVRWGRQKPRFYLEQGKLILANSPVPNPSEQASFHDWLIKHTKTYNIFVKILERLLLKEPNTDTLITQKKKDQQNLKNRSFNIELYTLGTALVQKMNEVSKQHGINFSLITQIKYLYQEAIKQEIHAIDVSNALNNPNFSLPNGLGHINESGNGVLAWEIAKHLKSSELIPKTFWRE